MAIDSVPSEVLSALVPIPNSEIPLYSVLSLSMQSCNESS